MNGEGSVLIKITTFSYLKTYSFDTGKLQNRPLIVQVYSQQLLAEKFFREKLPGLNPENLI